jgi:hypothetical protein
MMIKAQQQGFFVMIYIWNLDPDDRHLVFWLQVSNAQETLSSCIMIETRIDRPLWRV